MTRVVRAFPLLAGKRDGLISFLAELNTRQEETKEFYRSYGVTRESVHLQTTSRGDLVIICTDLGNAAPTPPDPTYAAFHAWFKSKVLEFIEVDYTTQQPKSAGLFDWQDSGTLR